MATAFIGQLETQDPKKRLMEVLALIVAFDPMILVREE